MKGRKIITILIIINLILVGMVYTLISKINVNNKKQVIKGMTQSENEANLNGQITQLNKSHTDYANYIDTNKTNLATVLRNAGVETNETDNFETMINNVSDILSIKANDNFTLVLSATLKCINGGTYDYTGEREIIVTRTDGIISATVDTTSLTASTGSGDNDWRIIGGQISGIKVVSFTWN